MAVNLTTPITGSAQTGFTAPTYTIVADNAPPGSGGRQWAVTALGGTQAGVTVSTIARPFTITVIPPKSLKTLEAVGVDGVIRNVPRNNWRVLGRAGVLPLAGQANQVAICRVSLEIPAGADTADPAQIRALISATVGALSQQSAGLGDTTVSGIL